MGLWESEELSREVFYKMRVLKWNCNLYTFIKMEEAISWQLAPVDRSNSSVRP